MINKNFKKRILTSFFLFLLVFMIYNYNFILIYSLIILGILSIIEFNKIIKLIFKKNLKKILINFFFIIYIFLFCYLFLFFSNFIGLKIILYILLVGCIASDIGGFIFGKLFKGPKLTKISPNKTYSGSLGSIILATFLISILFFFLINNLNIIIVLIGIMTSIFCQIGDLFFSYLKRKARIKDTGNFLPGHGGVLDRLDGILLGIPAGFLTLITLT